MEAIPLGSRILTVILKNAEGQTLCITSAHFHHKSAIRLEQWNGLYTTLAALPYEHKILLADHNSIVVPSRDSNPVFDDKVHSIVQARDLEIKALHQLQMADAYVEVHSGHGDPKQIPPDGFTYGFGIHDTQDSGSDSHTDKEQVPHNLRCIDRIHISLSLLPHLTEAHTIFIAKADHKAVIALCKPPEFECTTSKFRCPTDILSDEEAT